MDEEIHASAKEAIDKLEGNVVNIPGKYTEEELKERIACADTLIERLEATLKLQEARDENRDEKPTPGLQILGSMNEAHAMDMMVLPYKESDRVLRWGNIHPQAISGRRAQGFQPVKNEKGEDVVYGDAILLSMPKRQFTETIVAPKKKRKAILRHGTISQLKDMAADNKVKLFGKINYDDGESIEVGDREE